MMQTIEFIALFPTAILLAIILSQYIIILSRRRQGTFRPFFPDLSILVPAHNEGRYLRGTIKAILGSGYKGKKEIIVIDDGSSDSTPDIIRGFRRNGLIRSIRTPHVGKSNALNRALKLASHKIVVVVDGDSEMEPDALASLMKPLADPKVGAVAGTIKVKNRKEGALTWFQKVEYLYFSFFRSICDRINGTIFTPGPLSAYRKELVMRLGGFSPKLYMEDVDISIRIVKAGYRIKVVDSAMTRTNVPTSLREWSRQRYRWNTGGIELAKSNLKFYFRRKFSGSSFYSLPILTYWYFHALIMGIVLFYQIFGGYYQYFYIHGDVLSFNVAQYFVYWFSVLGIV
ncbi:MAG: glycosyltransferase, partial [Candidatus Aenigmatarchaeota archaeon]